MMSAGPEIATASHPPCTRFTHECDFWSWGEGSLRPECCTEHLMELAEFASDLLKRHRIVHWLDYGSLLGAVREGELIRWDGDVDFGMLQHDRAALLGLADEVELAGHHLDQSLPGVIRIVYSDINSSHLDLFLWEVRDGLLLPQDDMSYAWPGMSARLAFPERFLGRLVDVSLYGRHFPAPAPAHEFLRDHRYGPDYDVPTRPILSVGLYPTFDLDEATPAVERLLSHIASRDQRLAQLRSASRWSRHRAFELWQKAALPISPAPGYLREVLDALVSEHSTPTVQALTASAALLDQAIDEFQHPSLWLPFRRAWRRMRRIAEVLLARMQHRPHRAGFPFGVEGAEQLP
jgi:hypothetical protein